MNPQFATWFVAQALAIGAAAPTGPALTGERARDLDPGDVAEIIRLAAPYSSVWRIDVEETFFIKPPNLQAGVYLTPDTISPALCRGRFLMAYQEESSHPSGYEWRVVGGAKAWAQVASPGGECGAKAAPPRTLDRPFRVEGQPTDADLVSLVKFIRGSPVRPGRWTEEPDGSSSLESGAEVDGTNPIASIVKKAECFFEVTTESRQGAGEIIEVSRTDDGWQVVSVLQWVV